MAEHYKTLGISENASAGEIEAKVCEIGKILDFESRMFKKEFWTYNEEEVAEAYKILINPESRLAYDKKRKVERQIQKNEQPVKIQDTAQTKQQTELVREQKGEELGLWAYYAVPVLFILVISAVGGTVIEFVDEETLVFFASAAFWLIVATFVGIGIFKFRAFWIDTAPERMERREERRLALEARRRLAQEERERNQHDLEIRLRQAKEAEMEKYRKLRKEIEEMPKYENWRNAVFTKCGRRCEMCGSTENLEIHHRKSFHSLVKAYGITNTVDAFECDALWNVDSGNVLCKECHNKMESSRYHQAFNSHS